MVSDRELRRVFGKTLGCLAIIGIGGMALAMKEPMIPHSSMALLGGMIMGAVATSFIIIINLTEHPRLYRCVQGGILLSEKEYDRLSKQRANWRKI